MLSHADNERLTRVGPGTPMGNVFRRYWLPALLSSEVGQPDGAPVRLRLLGEDLVAFRDSEGRVGIVDAGELTAKGAFGNLPCGEGFIAPVEGTAEGTLVVDGSIAAIGLVESPVHLTVEGGHLTGATGDQGARLMELLTVHGPDGTNVAELGIGTNEEAILTGNILEDEKIFGTAHVAFGASAGIGGTIQVPVHLDVVIKEPTVEIDGEAILGGGELLI